jgi:hypothetical protein
MVLPGVNGPNNAEGTFRARRERQIKKEKSRQRHQDNNTKAVEANLRLTREAANKIQSVARGFLVRRHFLGILKFRVNAQKKWRLEAIFDQYCEMERLAMAQRVRKKRTKIRSKLKRAFTKGSKLSMAALKSEVPHLTKHTSLVVKLHKAATNAREHLALTKQTMSPESNTRRTTTNINPAMLEQLTANPQPPTATAFSLDTVMSAIGHAGKISTNMKPYAQHAHAHALTTTSRSLTEPNARTTLRPIAFFV